ncbi:glycosyltransferase family 4 protein [Candidatus Uhrbacteria bacterium]|nr:MAG: glycosyltransferase family 4 protein [Candidatus Uhrbacteria bacterium]
MIQVLPYRNQQAWVQALKEVSVRTKEEIPAATWSHRAMSERVEGVLVEAERKEGPMQTLMFSFDRALLDTESASMRRIQDLAGEGMVQAVVLSHFKTDEIAQVDHVTAYGFSGSGFIRFYRAIVQGIRIVNAVPKRTLVTAQDPFIAGAAAYLVSRIKNVPLEVQEHGDFYSGYWKKESWKNRCLSLVGRFVLGQAERVRVVSDRVKEYLIAVGIKAEKIEVIPVAVELPSGIVRGGGSDVFRFVVPCRFVEQKGLDVLLKAAALLKQENVSFHLSIIGRGPLLSSLHGMIESKGLVKEVDIQDWKEGNDVWRDADGFVMSSRYEGFGRTVLEAMASKVAVVATDVGCVGSVLRPGVDGRVVSIGNAEELAVAMKATIVDKESTDRMIASAYERAKDFHRPRLFMKNNALAGV